MDALEFRVEVGGSRGRGYEVILRGPDGGAVSNSVRLPLRELEALAARVPDAVIASAVRVRRAVSDEERPVRELGTILFDAVLGRPGRGMYYGYRRQAALERRALRVVLQVRPPELARLPWEFLFDSVEDDYVALSAALVRSPLVSAPEQPLRVAGPLQILGMAARPADQPELAVAAEQQRLSDALRPLERAGLVKLDWVTGQSWRHLQAKVRQGEWHVLHFIGHGGFNATTREGALALAAEEGGGTHLLGAESLTILLRDTWSLRLVVLNACDTGRASALDEFSSTAGALIRRGTPAVLAMQHAITDKAALEFSRTFYEELARQQPVERCVTHARRAIRIAWDQSLEWGTPVLYMRSPDGALFDLADAAHSYAWASRFADPVLAERDPGRRAANLEAMYTEGLAALYTERWDDAVEVFTAVTAIDERFKDSAGKLKLARQGQRKQHLASMYAAGRAGAEAGRWEEAIERLQAVVTTEPGYRDARQLLEQAHWERNVAELRAEAAALHRAGQWEAVLAVGQRLAALTPDTPDPDGLIASARAAQHRARVMADAYQRAREHISAREWDEALRELTAIEETEPGYRDVQPLLERIRRGREAARLRTEAAALHRARQWQAVLDIGQRLAALTPDTPDPDGLIASARAALEAEQRARSVADAYQRAQAHIRASEWDEALRELTAIEETEPDHWGVQQWREHVRRELEAAGLRTEAAALYRAGQWQAVLDIGDRLTALKVYPSDPDGLVDSAWTVLEADRRAPGVAGTYQRAVQHIEAGEWDEACRELAAVQETEPRYRDIAQLSDRVRRELARAAGISDDPVVLATIKVGRKARAVAFSPDGNRLALGCARGTVLIVDLTGREQLRIRVGHRFSDVVAVAFARSGGLLATACHVDARVWDASTGTPLLKLTHDNSVDQVAFSPDGRLLATASYGSARVWDAVTGAQVLKLTQGGGLRDVAFSPDGRLLATATIGGAQVWDADTGTQLFQVARMVASMAFSPDGRLFATADYWGVQVSDAGTGHQLVSLDHRSVEQQHELFIARTDDLAFSPDGRLLATADQDKTARLWQLREQTDD